MGWIGFVGIILLAALPVRVTPVSGEPFSAELQRVGPDQIQLAVDGDVRQVPLAEVTRLERAETADVVGPTITVALTDGSRLKAEGLEIKGSDATIRLRRQDPLVVPLKSLAWVRFRSPSAGTDDAWLGMIGEATANDRLVIRRSATAIDQMPGVVTAVDDTKVQFDLGSQVIPAPVARLEGLIFAGSGTVAESPLVVTDILGSQWAAESLATSSDGTELIVTRSGGGERSLALDQMKSIRIAGNALWLAEQPPVDKSYTPLVESSLDKELLGAWLGAQSVDGRDLVMRSKSSVTYRIEPDFRVFTTRMLPDASVAAGTGAVVRILMDDAVVWSETILPTDEARGVELNVGDARRVTLEVDFGDGDARGDAGDVIRFIQPRLMR